jgi:kinesin family protein C2/C3
MEEPVVSVVPFNRDPDSPSEGGSEMSSLTGHGYDQEIVEELHQALNDLRAELAESRAEAARAVKVAEHAIQSAEKNTSQDWQNTVTHKAAEAAATAQKRSAEAMAKQRVAEERLEGERRTAAFWRKQAEVAEEEAGALQTRAAAAEVQRSAMDEELQSHLYMASAKVESLKNRFSSTEVHQKLALEAALERNRALELELEATRIDLAAKKLHQENSENTSENHRLRKKLSLLGRGKKKVSGSDVSDSKSLLARDSFSSSSPAVESAASAPVEGLSMEQILKLHAETASMRKQFELLQKATSDQLRALPGDSKKWVEQIAELLSVSQAEAERLRLRLAVESASRRKLLYEVQDLRGAVRVYCRVRPLDRAQSKSTRLISLPSQETLMLHREKFGSTQDNLGPMSFDFDRVFDPEARQQDVYSEIADVCLGVLDGYKICLMAYGQTGSGKTRSLLGDVNHTVVSPEGNGTRVQIDNHGIQLQALRQLYSVAEHRSDRFKDTFSITIVEVHNERLCDLMAGTATAEARGRIVTTESKSSSRRKNQKSGDDDASSGKLTKLEIRTDLHGDTAVHGVLSVDVESFDEACKIWDECLEGRETRLAEQGLDAAEYEASSHVIATVKVMSANIATGQGSVGRIQFVDLAGADLIPRRGGKQVAPSTPDSLVSGVGNANEWKYKNRSLETLNEVVTARSQFVRSVPYRNSTLTHLLRDSLEADTKVLLLACVSSDPKDMQETASTLRFASRMRRVTIGKATKHTVSPP